MFAGPWDVVLLSWTAVEPLTSLDHACVVSPNKQKLGMSDLSNKLHYFALDLPADRSRIVHCQKTRISGVRSGDYWPLLQMADVGAARAQKARDCAPLQ